MVQTVFKKGLNPVNAGGRAAPFNGGFNVYRASSTNAAIFSGDPVALNAGGKVVLATAATQDILGVAVGFAWISPATKQVVESRYLPANTSSSPGMYEDANFGADSGAVVRVIDDPEQYYAVRATSATPLTIAKLGDKLPWLAAAGSTLTGQSGGMVTASTATSTAFLRCVGVLKDVNNDWGVSGTIVLVKLDDTVGL